MTTFTAVLTFFTTAWVTRVVTCLSAAADSTKLRAAREDGSVSGPGAVDRDRIIESVCAQPHRFGVSERPRPDMVSVRLLGRGESYTAWLVQLADAGEGTDRTTTGDAVVVRVARRPVGEMPRPMVQEFRALGEIPAGIGPRPIRLEDDPDLLGAAFMVTSLVPGRHVDPPEWTPNLLRAHAGQLAALHARTYRSSGRIGVPPQDHQDRVSLLNRFTNTLAWWRSAHPLVVAEPDVAALVPRVRDRIAAASAHFQRLRRFAVVHGDLVLENILVDPCGVPRYVDWEWAEIGDPAQDLASLGGPIGGPSWYLPMDDEQIDLLLRTYVEATGTDEDTVDSLRARRDAWQVYGRFITSLHFRRLRGTPQERCSGYATRTADSLINGLLQFLS